ncbi:hypothetical protein HYFRA_00013013 [Hymenoscyphus fraxineus]|uniref:LPXTG-motif cell wall anchor domain protein n=1 Tax=Hymenoscyphus fraxineus TaxID=746836 RepID=A0A9N9PXB7_9HELO|nr:hypothetical protein HYFRA_00013013 [Hymenoscyphus fraxineus]
MEPPERVSCLPTYRPQDFKLVEVDEESDERVRLLHRLPNPVNPLLLAPPAANHPAANHPNSRNPPLTGTGTLLPQTQDPTQTQNPAQTQTQIQVQVQAQPQVQDEERCRSDSSQSKSQSPRQSQSATTTPPKSSDLLVLPQLAAPSPLPAGHDYNDDRTNPNTCTNQTQHQHQNLHQNQNQHLHPSRPRPHPHLRTHSTHAERTKIAPPDALQLQRSASLSQIATAAKPAFASASQVLPGSTTSKAKPSTKQARSSHRRNNGLERGPPPAMLTQGSYKLEIDTTSTTDDWVQSQQITPSPNPLTSKSQPPPSPAQPTSARSFDSAGSRPLIKPIRGFKPSSRKSSEMALRRSSQDAEGALRALEGYRLPRRISDPSDTLASDDSDMFLRAAREQEEEESPREVNGRREALTRLDSRRPSRIGQRASLMPPNHLYQPSLSRRNTSDQESTVSRSTEERPSGNGRVGQVLTYRPSERSDRDRMPPSALDDINKSRFHGSYIRSSPTTPRAPTSREMSLSPESPAFQGRRGSYPDPASVLPSRQPTYRQSNLSYAAHRNQSTSPLVSRVTDTQETHATETGRTAEGTESSVSTTAPSTVWDELEDLKSRINRLELTRKLPATSGAAMSRVSNDRPPTATTTVTTMSTSPKQRARGNSVSPIDGKDTEPPELHPLLHSALAKSKPLLSPEIYSALEATAADALTIAAMMGTSGQPGPISSAQSTIDRPMSNVSDRQVRRKVDSMCRGLTELCLALCDGKLEASSQITLRPGSRDADTVIPSVEQPVLPPINTNLARVKASPRALSSLEARRSTLLNMPALPSPRYTPSESGTPTQANMAGRRSSLLVIRNRRGHTEEPEEKEDIRIRAPSRAFTDMGRFKNLPPREPAQQDPPPERAPTVQSCLPVRRHIATSSLTNPTPTPAATPASRKYLDRPAAELNGPISRLAEQRKSGFGVGRANSLIINRRLRPSSTNDSSIVGQYQ